MEGILRGQKPSEMIPFDLEADVLYYPIRHHSPLCARHLEEILNRYRPECILVEGPENANDLIALLTDPQTQPPVALFCACREEGPDPVTHRCYYPFLDTSPELVALRYAAAQGIPAAFMDLSYGEILLATKEARGFRTQAERQSYADDRYLAQSRFQASLCERAGVRDFEEFWEKYFEAGATGLTAEEFVYLMHTYCLLIRQDTRSEELHEDGCLAREVHMAVRIAQARKRYRKTLVVAGGFHIWGLLHPDSSAPKPGASAKLQQAVYPMRYSLAAADALNGYCSGIPAPGFYDTLWQRMHDKENPWEEAILDYIVKTGKAMRKRGENVSAHDERCAYELALGLAALRNKRHPGLYELQDGILSAFVKGEASLSGLEPLRLLRRLTTGTRVGTLAESTVAPPISRDFQQQFKRCRLNPEGKRDAVLSILSDQKHRDISRFLHQTVFLDCGFANRRRGPDLLQRRDRNLIREVWDYRWSPQVDSALIEHALSGATVREACAHQLHQKMSEAQRSATGAALLLQALMMGIGDRFEDLSSKMEELLISDGDFTSLAEACRNLYTLHQWQDQYGEGSKRNAVQLLNRCFDRVVLLLPGLHSVDESRVGEVQNACALLYELTLQPDFSDRRQKLREALESLISQSSIQPTLHGMALGLLYGMEPGRKAHIDSVLRGYLQGTLKHRAAPFLRGLFSTARDLLLTDGDFLGHIDALFAQMEDEAFIQALPELRLAFSYFLPTETDHIAKQVARLHGTESKMIRNPGVDPAAYAFAERVDAWAAARLDRMGGEMP